jgi:predicted nucleotidyltransferase
MPALVAQHPVMVRFRRALDAAYGERLERAVLYGSRARGEVRPDSDWDVAVFIQSPGELWDEAGRLAAIESAKRKFPQAILLAQRCRRLRYRSFN